MSIERNLLMMAQKIQDECMSHNNNCDDCPLVHNCIIPEPYTWKIPDPPPEPTKRQRIEWMRMFKDEIIDDYERQALQCCKCKFYNTCSNEKKTSNTGHIAWWREAATLEQFRKDVGLSNDTDS